MKKKNVPRVRKIVPKAPKRQTRNESTNSNNLGVIVQKSMSPEKMSPVVLLSTNEEKSNNISEAINLLSKPNISIRKIPFNCNRSENQKLNSDKKPYLLIVSDKKNENKSFQANCIRNKNAILKIEIDRKLNNVKSNKSKVNSSKMHTDQSQTNTAVSQDWVKNIEEVEIDDVTSSNVVVFKFDTYTKKITVSKRKKLNESKVNTEENLTKSQLLTTPHS